MGYLRKRKMQQKLRRRASVEKRERGLSEWWKKVIQNKRYIIFLYENSLLHKLGEYLQWLYDETIGPNLKPYDRCIFCNRRINSTRFSMFLTTKVINKLTQPSTKFTQPSHGDVFKKKISTRKITKPFK